MVEFLMIFALGALTATFAGLLVVPALARRAERLAQRRVEAQFPLSIAELAAERDRMRAEMAVETRRAEERAEAALRDKAADMAELGRRTVTIHGLELTVTEREARLAETEGKLAAAQRNLEAEQARLAEAQAAFDRQARVLADVEASRAALHDLQNDTARELGATRAALQAELDRARARIAALEEERADLAERHETAAEALRRSEVDATGLRAALIRAEERAARLEPRVRSHPEGASAN